MNIMKLSPVLYAEHIEPCLEFWTRLGFAKTTELAHGGQRHNVRADGMTPEAALLTGPMAIFGYLAALIALAGV